MEENLPSPTTCWPTITTSSTLWPSTTTSTTTWPSTTTTSSIDGYCYYFDIFGAFITACVWIAYNKLMLCISFCYANRVKHKNVFYEYSLVWIICILNLVASILIILLFCSAYYSDNYTYIYYSNDVPWPIFRASISMTALALFFSVILVVQLIHQFCITKNRQVLEYSYNQQENAPQTTEISQQLDNESPPPYPQKQEVAIQDPPQQHIHIQTQPQDAPTFIQLPNGQLQLIQPGQAQTVYVAPPNPQPIYKTSEEHLASFTLVEAIMMMMNIVFAAICVAYLSKGFQLCNKYDSHA